jgi:hypothetical protein
VKEMFSEELKTVPRGGFSNQAMDVEKDEKKRNIYTYLSYDKIR